MTLKERIGDNSRPVVIQFHAPWCGPCKAISPHVDAMAKEFEGRVEVVRIDVDKEPELAQEAGVRGVPTLVVYRDGAEVRRHSGMLGRDGLNTLFRSATNEASSTEPVGRPRWHLAAKLGGAFALLVLSSQIPSLDWTKWVGFGLLFWGMREMCPSCQTPATR